MKIEWTEPALSDLESIREYIRKDSEYYATRFVDGLGQRSHPKSLSPISDTRVLNTADG